MLVSMFTFQPLSATDQFIRAYQENPHTKELLDRLSISTSMDEHTILELPATYPTVIARSLLDYSKVYLFTINTPLPLLNIFVVLLLL